VNGFSGVSLSGAAVKWVVVTNRTPQSNIDAFLSEVVKLNSEVLSSLLLRLLYINNCAVYVAVACNGWRWMEK